MRPHAEARRLRAWARERRIRCAFQATSAALVLLVVPRAALTAPTVFFEGEPYCAENPGDRFTASVWVDASPDSIGCYHLFLTYDRTRLMLRTAAEGDLFASAGFPTFFIWEDQQADTTAFTDCLLGAGTFVQGPGEILRLEFELRSCTGPRVVPLDLTESRANPPPYQTAFLADVRRMLIPGVVYADGHARICQSCTGAIREENAPGAAVLELSPNPAADLVRIDWALPLAAATLHPGGPPLISVFDPMGRRMLTRPLPGGRAGSTVLPLIGPGASRLPAGVYWVTLRAEGFTLTRKFVHLE